MKKYIKSSKFISKMNPAFKYFQLFDNDKLFMDVVGLSDEDMEGFRIGDSVDDYTLVGHAISKDKYFDRLSDEGYDILDIYQDGSKYFLGISIDSRLYDVTSDVLRIFED